MNPSSAAAGTFLINARLILSFAIILVIFSMAKRIAFNLSTCSSRFLVTNEILRTTPNVSRVENSPRDLAVSLITSVYINKAKSSKVRELFTFTFPYVRSRYERYLFPISYELWIPTPEWCLSISY